MNLNLLVKLHVNLCCKSHKGRSVNDKFGHSHLVRAAHILHCYWRCYTRHSVSCYIRIQIYISTANHPSQKACHVNTDCTE